VRDALPTLNLILSPLAALGRGVVAHRRRKAELRMALAEVAMAKEAAARERSAREALEQSLEVRVAERTRELSDVIERYRGLVETTLAIPWEMAPGTTRLTYMGPLAEKMFGYPLPQCLEEGFFVSKVHEEDIDEVRAWFSGLREDGTYGEIEQRIRAASGEFVWVRVIASASRDAAGRLVRRGVFLDITARHRIEREHRIAQKLESVGRLASGVAHEVNTPVQFVSDNVRFAAESFTAVATVVAGFRAVVAAGPAERDALVEAARRADAQADTDYLLEDVPHALMSSLEGLDKIAKIVRALKTFSRQDQEEKAPLDLNASITSILTIGAHEYKHVADVQVDLGDLPLVRCHGGEINQVLLNLVVNAAAAISEAVAGTDKRGTIKVRTWREDDMALVCVRDTGTGIPSKIWDKIFDPFFTTKDVGHGTGQGLSVARSVAVDRHGGDLTFETEVGRGTAFVLRLPIDVSAMAIAA